MRRDYGIVFGMDKPLPTLDHCPHCGGSAYFGDIEGVPAICCGDCEAVVVVWYREDGGDPDWPRAAKTWNARLLYSVAETSA